MGYRCQIWCQKSIDKTGMFMYCITTLKYIHMYYNFQLLIVPIYCSYAM